MEESILGLPSQFQFEPEIQRKDKLITSYENVLVVGMGGSHLCGEVLKAINPSLPISIHSDYGLPKLTSLSKDKTLVVIVSFSGNTEETIDAFKEASTNGFNIAVITTGGKLEDLAEEKSLPMIIVPNTGIQPRNAIGFLTLSLAYVLGDVESIEYLKEMSFKLKPKEDRLEAQAVVSNFIGFIPIIYSSLQNKIISYNWKIKFNETTKIPAFYNVFPELNHNEMEGFGVIDRTRSLSSSIVVCFLFDMNDNARIRKRMDVTQKIYEENGIKTLRFKLKGSNVTEKIFKSLLVADWISFELALSHYNTDYEKVPVIERFKNIIN